MTLDDAVEYLKDSFTERSLEIVKDPEEVYTLSWQVRQTFDLWEDDSELAQWFKAREVQHPDDMSRLILKKLRCDLIDEPFDLDEEIEDIKDFWNSD